MHDPRLRRGTVRSRRAKAIGRKRRRQVGCPVQPVVVGIGIVEEAELLVLPVELPGVRDDAADAVAVPAHPLGQGVHHDVRPVVDGLQQVGGRERGVDDEGKTVRMGDLRHLRDVDDVENRVADGLDEDGARLRRDRLLVCLGVVVLDEIHLDPELGKDGVEHRVRSAVEVAGGDDLVPHLGEGDDGVVNSRGTRSESNRRRAALQQGDPLLQHVLRGVHDPRVDVAQLLQGEEVRRPLGAREHVRARPINRHPARCRRIDLLPAVHREGLDPQFIAHPVLLLAKIFTTNMIVLVLIVQTA